MLNDRSTRRPQTGQHQNIVSFRDIISRKIRDTLSRGIGFHNTSARQGLNPAGFRRRSSEDQHEPLSRRVTRFSAYHKFRPHAIDQGSICLGPRNPQRSLSCPILGFILLICKKHGYLIAYTHTITGPRSTLVDHEVLSAVSKLTYPNEVLLCCAF